jgi:Protein of unknown function (DUF3829)
MASVQERPVSSIKFRVLSCVGVAVSLSGGAFGCKKLMSMASQAGGADASSAASTGDDGDAQKSARLNEYVECMNFVSASARQSRDTYLNSVDEQKGPDRKTMSHIYISNLQMVEECKKALAKAKTLQPPMPEFDALADPYEKALGELAPLVDQAYKYYDNKDFKDDQLAKGIAMHAPLLASFRKFFDANKALDDKVTKLNDELSQRRLALLAKDPQARLHYLVEKAESDAKILVEASAVNSLKDLDLGKYTALLDGYERALDELDSYASAHKDEVDKVTLFSRFDDTARDFLKASKELMRRKRDNKEFTETGPPASIDGHPAQVMERYNTLINSSNSLYFR